MIKSQKGQSLVEALIALGVAVVIISGIAVAVITSVNNTDFSKNQNLATQYAQQGMELVRHKSESDWGSFTMLSGSYCLDQNSTDLSPAGLGCSLNINDANSNPFFIRQVDVSQNTSSCTGSASVSVKVSWTDGKCSSASNVYCHTVKLDSCLANINSVPTP